MSVWGERGGFGRGRKPTIVMNAGMHDLTLVGDPETSFAGVDNPDPAGFFSSSLFLLYVFCKLFH